MFWWITVIGGIAVVILIWSVTTVPVDMLMTIVKQGDDMGTRPLSVLDKISDYWNIAPVLLVLGLLFFAFMKIFQKEGEERRY